MLIAQKLLKRVKYNTIELRSRYAMLKIGCVGWAWQAPPPSEFGGFEEPIRKVAALGFEGIELIGNRETLRDYYTPKRVRNLREMIRSCGLELTEFVSFTQEMNHPDEKVRDRVLADFEKGCDVAAGLGTKIINTIAPWPAGTVLPNRSRELKFTLHLPQDYSWENDWKTYVESMKECVRMAEERDLRVAIEAFPHTLCCTADSFLKLIEDVGSKRLGFNLDTSHLMAQNQYVTMAVYKLKDRIFHTHIKDNDGMSRGNLPAGTGVVDYEELVSALKQVGYDHVLSIEVEGTDKPERYLRQAKEHLKKILEGTW